MDCQTVRTELHIEPEAAAIQEHLSSCAACGSYADRFARLDQALRTELVVTAPAAVAQELALAVAAPAADRLELALHQVTLVEAPAALTVRLLDLVPQPARAVSPVESAVRDALLVQAPPALTARLLDLVPQPAAHPSLAPAVPAPVLAKPQPRRWVVATVYFVTAALLLFSMFYAGEIYSTVIRELGLQEWLTMVAGLPAQLLSTLYTAVPQSRIVIGAFVRIQQPLQWLLVALVVWAIVDMTQRQSQRGRRYA